MCSRGAGLGNSMDSILSVPNKKLLKRQKRAYKSSWSRRHKIQMHSFLKVESLVETRCRKSWTQFIGYYSQSVRGSYSARVPRSSSARVHREFVHHILEDEVDGQEEGLDDKRDDGEQIEESGEVEESQNKRMSA